MEETFLKEEEDISHAFSRSYIIPLMNLTAVVSFPWRLL
jgi:hypothetical protein